MPEHYQVNLHCDSADYLVAPRGHTQWVKNFSAFALAGGRIWQAAAQSADVNARALG